MNKYDNAMMKTAFIWAEESYCKRKQVGAVISKENRVVSIGYNGTIIGAENCCEEEIDGKLTTKDTVIHAEENAILFATRSGYATKDCTIYVTLSPCINCSKMIIQSGIKEVIFSESYKGDLGVKFLKEAGIKVRKLND